MFKIIFGVMWAILGFIAWGYERGFEYWDNDGMKDDTVDKILMLTCCVGLGGITFLIIYMFGYHKYNWRLW